MLDDRGLTVRDLARAAGVSTHRAQGWIDNRTAPGRWGPALDTWLLSQGIHPRRAFAFEADMSDRTPSHLRLLQPRSSTDREDDMPENLTRQYLDPAELKLLELPIDPFDGEGEDAFLNPHLRTVETALGSAITSRHLIALTGPIGSGKTTLIQRLYARVSDERRIQLIMPASLDRHGITANTLAIAILRDLLGRDTSSQSQEQRSELLRKTLKDAAESRTFPALVIDEAHELSNRALVAIKQLWDAGLLHRQISAILVGHPELGGRLRKDPAVREVGARTRVLELRPYSAVDTAAYLRWRFARPEVGGDADKVFAPDAFTALATRGEHPLAINNLAVLSIRYALSRGDRQVNAVHVGRA
jgi:type II secretory pathway predicted ATPase ExeA